MILRRASSSFFAVMLALSWLLARSCEVFAGESCGPVKAAGEEGNLLNVDYILVIDSTASMTNFDGRNLQGQRCTRWEELRGKITEAVQTLSPGKNLRLHVLFFGGTVFHGDALDWKTPGPELKRVRGDDSSAWMFKLETERDRAQVVELVNNHRPAAGQTPLWDAIGAGFERAGAIHRQAPDRRIVLSVFTDGENFHHSGQRRFKSAAELCPQVEKIRAELGSALSGEGYCFVRVAGVKVNPPCHGLDVGHTPSIVQLRLGPAAGIEGGCLADREMSEPVTITWTKEGKALGDKAFPLVFESAPGKPKVRVICTNGGPAAVSASGTYMIRFQRMGPSEQYKQPFEGRLETDLGAYGRGAVEGVLAWDLGCSIPVRFAGLPDIEIGEQEIKPADGLRVLKGTTVTFEVPYRQGVTYEWRFEGPPKTEPAKGPVVRKVMDWPGIVKASLTLSQPKHDSKTFTRRIEVIDPQLELTFTPARPVEGERVEALLKYNPQLKVSQAEWSDQPPEVRELRARYSFGREGNYSISVTLKTDLGPASTSAVLGIGPGVAPPEILAPRDMLFLVQEAQAFEAEAGRAVSEVSFSLLKDGMKFDIGTGPVANNDGRWLAKLAKELPLSIGTGPAAVVAESRAKDAEVARRLGPQRATNLVEISKLALVMQPRMPTERTVTWNQPVQFEVELLGPGLRKVQGVKWDVFSLRGGQPALIPGLGKTSQDLSNEGDRKIALFTLTLNGSDPELLAQLQQGAMQVVATPLGDPQVVGDTKASWDALRLVWPSVRFAVVAPRRCLLDEKVELRVRDDLSGQKPKRVRWTLAQGSAQTTNESAGEVIDHVFREVGPHEIRAEVEWDGGKENCLPAPVFVEFEPIQASVTWDGGRLPELHRRAASPGATSKIVIDPLFGSRAKLSINGRQLDHGAWTNLQGWPKIYGAEAAKQPILVPWPELGRPCNRAEQSVELSLQGFSCDGQYGEARKESFRMVNHCPRNWAAMIWLLAALAVVTWVLGRLCLRNEGADYRVWLGSHAGRFGKAIQSVDNNPNINEGNLMSSIEDEMKKQVVPAAPGKTSQPVVCSSDLPLRHKSLGRSCWSLWHKRARIPLSELLEEAESDKSGRWPPWTKQTELPEKVLLQVREFSKMPGQSRLGFGIQDRRAALQPNGGLIDRRTKKHATEWTQQRPEDLELSRVADFMHLGPASSAPVGLVLLNPPDKHRHYKKLVWAFGGWLVLAIGIFFWFWQHVF